MVNGLDRNVLFAFLHVWISEEENKIKAFWQKRVISSLHFASTQPAKIPTQPTHLLVVVSRQALKSVEKAKETKIGSQTHLPTKKKLFSVLL